MDCFYQHRNRGRVRPCCCTAAFTSALFSRHFSCTEIEVFIDCTCCINCCTDSIYYITEIETVRCIYFAGTIFLGCTVCILLAQKTRVYGWFAEHKFPDFGIKSVVEISCISTVLLSFILLKKIKSLLSLTGFPRGGFSRAD